MTFLLMRKIYLFMKLFSIIFVLLISGNLHAQVRTNVQWTEQTSLSPADVIYYKPASKLVWGDFKGKPVEAGITAAITMSGFGYSASMHASGQNGQLDIKVYCFFNKNKSWVKPDKKTAYILTHEQRHFDVSYIAAKIFIDKVQGASMNSSNYNTLLSRIYNECIEIMNDMQNDYDEQTNNGQHKQNQEKWNRFIDDKLAIITN